MTRRSVRLALAFCLAAALTSSVVTVSPAVPIAAEAYDAGLSTPQKDSYYPAHGDPGVDTLHYGLQLDWNRGTRTLHGVADIRLRATADAGSFRLDLGRSMRVTRVLVDGEQVGTTHPGQILRIQAPVTAGQRYDVRIDYRGTPRPIHAPTTRNDIDNLGMEVTADAQLHTMQEPFGALTWYPVNDQPSDKALYDIRVSTPRDWVGVSNGTLVTRHRTKARTVTRWHLEHPAASYLITLAVGPYVHRHDTGPHGLPINFWLPRGKVGRYLPTLRHVSADLGWLEGKLGRYPFESAGVVVVPGRSAMETQTMVTFGKQTWTDDDYAREIIVHELAHQWWGDTVTPADWRDLWLNEGMAMYVEARWLTDKTRVVWPQWLDVFRRSNRKDRAEEGGPGAYDPDMFATNCVYYCTALMYETLRKDIGDHTFWRIVRKWTQSQPDQNVDRAGFEELVATVTGRDYATFFDRWLNSPVWPPR